jgi:hypothetical protein
MEIHGINSMEFFMKFHGIPQKTFDGFFFMKIFHGNPWNFMEFKGIPWKIP